MREYASIHGSPIRIPSAHASGFEGTSVAPIGAAVSDRRWESCLWLPGPANQTGDVADHAEAGFSLATRDVRAWRWCRARKASCQAFATPMARPEIFTARPCTRHVTTGVARPYPSEFGLARSALSALKNSKSPTNRLISVGATSSDSPLCEEFRVNNRRLNRLFRSMARNVGRELPRFGDAESPLEELCS